MALQELCLAKIVESFESYYQAYSATDKGDVQWRIQFLQRVYSRELAQRLKKKGLLQEKYADLVFNKHLTYLRTEWFSTFSLETIAQAFARIGPNLEKVVFNNRLRSCVRWKNFICHLTNVRKIKYQHSCNNVILERISKYCPELESLDVALSKAVTDSGLKYFYQLQKKKGSKKKELPCPQLKRIILVFTSVKGKGVKKLLKKMPYLEDIDYEYLPMVLHKIHKNDLQSLNRVRSYNLICLSFNYCTYDFDFHLYDNALKLCVSVCPNLKSFECYLLKLDHLNLCFMLPDLEDLNLCRIGDSRIDVSDFLREKCGKLTSLTLCKCTVSLSALVHSCIRLNQLIMDDVIIQYSKDIIPRFGNLKKCHVDGVDLSDSGNCKSIGRILRSSPVLHELLFASCSIITSEAKTEILKGCEQCALNCIDFWFCSVEEKFLEDIILRCCMLKCLNVMSCHISAESKENLRRVAGSLPNRPRIWLD